MTYQRLFTRIFAAVLVLMVGACTLISPQDGPPDNVANVGTGEAPPDVLTPDALRTPDGQPTAPPTDDRTCRAVNADVLAMRVMPDINAQEVTILSAGTSSAIIGRRGDNTWWQVQSGGQTGWLDASAVTVYGDCPGVPIVNTPTPAPTSTPTVPQASVKVNLNVRRGASVRFNPPIGSLQSGDVVEIIAVNTTGDWYKVVYAGSQGWISALPQYVEVSGNVSALAVDPGPPTPTATNTPIPATPTPTYNPNVNYLADPSFEGGYTGRGSADLNIPSAWQFSYYEQPREYEWQNLRPFAFPHSAYPELRSGANALNISRDYGTFTAVVYQQVQVPANISVRGSAWGWLYTCEPQPEKCTSVGGSGARLRVGIDPTGGTNPFAGSVVWSGFIYPHNTWQQASTSTVAQGGTVTLFLYSTQDTPTGINRTYWDDAGLFVGG